MERVDKTRNLKGMPLFYLFIAFYPILPSYTRMLGYPVYYFLLLGASTLVILLNVQKAKFISQRFLFGTILISTLYIIPFLVNAQPERILFEFLEVLLPLFFTCFVLKNDNNAGEKSISIILLISLIISAFGLVEAATGYNVFSLIENQVPDNIRFGSLQATRWNMVRIEQGFNTALTYALYQTLCFGLAFYRYLGKNQKQYLFLMVLQVLNIFLTWTRGVTFIFCAGVAGMLFVNRREFGFKRMVSIILIAAFGLSILMLSDPAVLEMFGRLFGAGLSILLTGTGGAYDDASISMRAGYQSAAFEALSKPRNLLFGVGEYGLRDMVSIDNEYLLEITGYGIGGLIAFIAILAIPVVVCIRGSRKAKRNRNTSTRMFYNTMLMSCLIYSASMYTVAQMADARIFYLIWGIILCYHRGNKKCEVPS